MKCRFKGCVPMVAIFVVAAVGCDADNGGGDGDGSITPPAKRIFVTRAMYDGNLMAAGGGATGLEGADNICNNTAVAANLGGTWVAWLSDSTTDAIDRVADVGPWYFVDESTLVFNNKANLSTTPVVNINNDEFGVEVSANIYGPYVWTGTLFGGRKAGSNCNDWTHNGAGGMGMIGEVRKTDNAWTEGRDYGCSSSNMLFCIEQ